MTKNPLINAGAASLYVIAVTILLQSGTQPVEHIDSALVPMAMLSLFVLSAAVMGYFFCLTPLSMYLDGQKKEAVTLFGQTILVFGAITAVLFFLLFSFAYKAAA